MGCSLTAENPPSLKKTKLKNSSRGRPSFFLSSDLLQKNRDDVAWGRNCLIFSMIIANLSTRLAVTAHANNDKLKCTYNVKMDVS